MKILITGNQGYVGPLVVAHLRAAYPDATLVGFDTGFFATSLTGAKLSPEHPLDEQLFGDVRDIPCSTFDGVDAVVHLAAVSNDPMGKRFEQVTLDVNCKASLDVAVKARRAGVSHFVFASSCSVYGFAPGAARSETDSLNPQTAYAQSKVATEQGLPAVVGDEMVVTSLRFATACGMSPRLRLDLVLNDFVASALATARITVLSDGTPWRPLIDVRDMARAIDWACTRAASNGGRILAVNVGSNDRNYQVSTLAHAVQSAVPGTDVSINHAAPADTRSYRVDFSHFAQLAPDHQPRVSLQKSIELLKVGLSDLGFADAEFRTSELMRLRVLESHIAAGRLAENLRWTTRIFDVS